VALNVNDIIEIVTHEGGCLHVRRVKLTQVRRQSAHYAVKAANLKGKYERSYQLPLEPVSEVRDPQLRDCVNWIVPNYLNGKADP